MKDPEIGSVATADLIVGESDLASALSFPKIDASASVAGLMTEEQVEIVDSYPRVFATSRMIALMEVASSRILTPLLEADELSVGAAISVSHSAPTPSNARVIATARYTGREDKLFIFEVVAHDDGGEIGRGIHKRAVINPDRLLDRAIARNLRITSDE